MNYRIVGKQNQAALLEWRDWAGMLQRTILPASTVRPDLLEEELRQGIPFGSLWEVNQAATLKLVNRLHEQGIWSYADAANRIREFRAVVNEVIVASLLDAARGGK